MIVRHGTVTLALVLAVGLLSCSEELSDADRVLLERQKFEVKLISWAPLPDGTVALDLEIRLRGSTDLDELTVSVAQVDSGQEVLQTDPVPLDVAGMEFDGQKLMTIHVPSAGETLDAVAVLLENIPDEEQRARYPEFGGS